LKFTVENFREDLGKTLGTSLAHVVFKWGGAWLRGVPQGEEEEA
jgi:hypothetical protein